MNKTTMPIKNREKIQEILTYMKGKSERNFLIAKLQLNTALRISDVLQVKVRHFVFENYKFKKHIELLEKKTKKKKFIALNEPLKNALKKYISENNLDYDDYIFFSRKGTNEPITTTQAHRIFADVGKALNIENFGSHSLRKTWGYFSYIKTKNIAIIMEVYQHTSEKVTLKYIGITQRDIDTVYMDMMF